MMISNQEAYLAAIALNNAGVILIHRQMHREAVATMQDALRLIRYSFPIANNETGNDLSLPVSHFDAALQAAWKRTSVTKISEAALTHSSQAKKIFIVADHDNPFIVHDTLLRTSNAFCVIKIDPFECLTACDNMLDRLEIESSIILYNYGIACTCFAEGVVETMDENRRKSMAILMLAQFGATKLLNDSLSYTPNHLDIPSGLLLVTMLLLDTLCHWCESGKISETTCAANPFIEDLTLILTIVTKREMVLSQEGIGLKAASPAA